MKFVVEQEAHNTADCFAVAVVKDETLVGHVLREVSHLVWHFIEHNGTGTCEVNMYSNASQLH